LRRRRPNCPSCAGSSPTRSPWRYDESTK